MHTKNLYWLVLSFIIIILDQWTKLLVVASLPFQTAHVIFPGFFNFMLDYNRGAAFNLLAHHNGWQRWFFIVIALIVCYFLVRWLLTLTPQKKWLACAIALITGGALGNLIDRVRLSYVIDFIQVYYQQYYWPTFNVADSAVVVGACMLGFSFLFSKE